MRALDTNVLVRFFIDDPDDREAERQRPAAIKALSERAFVPVTVLLEFEWVMRGFYALAPKEISRVLRALVGVEHVTIEDRAAVLVALDVFDVGMDLADALHVCRSGRTTAFATFDRGLARRAGRSSLTVPVELLK